MKKISLILSILVVFACHTYSQTDRQKAQSQWTFFDFDTDIEGVILCHEPIGSCGVRMTANITIVETDKDTIRILSLCDNTPYEIGGKVRIIGSPARHDSSIGSSWCYYVVGQPAKGKKLSKKEKQKIIDGFPSRFDMIVLRTAWGTIHRISRN